jgi:hypothetical protein
MIEKLEFFKSNFVPSWKSKYITYASAKYNHPLLVRRRQTT